MKKYYLISLFVLINACNLHRDLNCDGKDEELRLLVEDDQLAEAALFLSTEEGFDIDACCMEHKTRLQHAAWMGKDKMVKLLLKIGANPDKKDGAGNTALMWATSKGNTEIVKMLLGANANHNLVNNYGDTALSIAQKKRYEQIAAIISSQPQIPEATVVVQELSGKGIIAKKQHQTVQEVLQAQGKKKEEIKKIIRKSPAIMLCWAVREGNVELVSKLFEKGATINSVDNQGKKAFTIAIESKDIDIITLFLKNGADVNSVDNQGYTPMVRAVEGNDPKMAACLIDNGADANGKIKNGDAFLMHAAEKGYLELAELLLDRGATVNEKDEDSFTALHFAAWKCPKEKVQEVVELLLDRGAKVNEKTKSGKTPLKLAAYNGKTAVAELLSSRGGRK